MNFLNYLRFIPLLSELITFIREAEATYKAPGSGTSKFNAVVTRFTTLVEDFGVANLIPAKLETALVTGIPAIVEIVVQLMKAGNGGKIDPANPVVDNPVPIGSDDATTKRFADYDSARNFSNATAGPQGQPNYYPTVLYYKSTANYGVWPVLPAPAGTVVVTGPYIDDYRRNTVTSSVDANNRKAFADESSQAFDAVAGGESPADVSVEKTTEQPAVNNAPTLPGSGFGIGAKHPG